MRLTLTDAREISTLTNALSVAAARFDEDAKTCRDVGPSHEPLAKQFDQQAKDARALMLKIELQEEAQAEVEDDDEPREDTGRYQGGYRTFRDGSTREDFRSDC